LNDVENKKRAGYKADEKIVVSATLLRSNEFEECRRDCVYLVISTALPPVRGSRYY
jgi:hypothetical protein